MEEEKDIIKKFRSDKKVREKFIEGIKNSGLLLEYEVEAKLFNNGFSCNESLYVDKSSEGDISRQIDICANKFYETIEILDQFAVFPVLTLVGDCKYTSKEGSCLISINILDRSLSETIINFPYFVNGDCFFEYFPKGLQADRLVKFFGDFSICHKLENFNYHNFKREKGSPEKTIHQICESQVMPALVHYHKRFLSTLVEQYKIIDNKASKFFVYKTESKDQKDKFFKSLPKIVIPLHFFIPLIVTNKKLVSLDLKNENLNDIEEVPYLLYLHKPSNINKFESFLDNNWTQPILIVNDKCLDKGISFIEKGISSLINLAKNKLKKSPDLVIKDAKIFSQRKIDKLGII